jgi:hypothetical protein
VRIVGFLTCYSANKNILPGFFFTSLMGITPLIIAENFDSKELSK